MRLLSIFVIANSCFCLHSYLLALPNANLRVSTKVPRTIYKNSISSKSLSLYSSAATVQIAAAKAILKLLSACSISIYITKRGILDKNSISVLSKLIFDVFQPCLLFVNVAFTVAKARAAGETTIFLLPIAAIFQVLSGFVLGKLISSVLYGPGKKSDDSSQLVACTTFANSGPLPLVFTDSLFRNLPDQTILPRSVAYISMYLLTWSPLFWSLGTSILGDSNANSSPEEARKRIIKRVVSPPMIGCLSGLIIGLVPALQRLFLSPSGLLNPLLEAMRTLSMAYLPAVVLVLGGSLVPKEEDLIPENTSCEIDKEVDNKFKFIKRVFAVYLSRFLLMPFLALSTIRLVRKVFPSLIIEPLLLFILLLESCMPCAQNGTVILQLEKKYCAAASMARTLLAVYVLGIPAMSFWLVQILKETALLAP